MNYTIRSAQFQEYDDLNRIKLDASLMIGPHYARPLNREVFSRCFTQGDVTVISDAGILRGYSMAYDQDDDLYIRNLFVARDYTHRGLGTLLLDRLVEVAKRRHRRAITLVTGLRAPWNAPYYGRHGFTVIRELLPEYLQHSLDAEKASFGVGDISPPESPYLLPRVAMANTLR